MIRKVLIVLLILAFIMFLIALGQYTFERLKCPTTIEAC